MLNVTLINVSGRPNGLKAIQIQKIKISTTKCERYLKNFKNKILQYNVAAKNIYGHYLHSMIWISKRLQSTLEVLQNITRES